MDRIYDAQVLADLQDRVADRLAVTPAPGPVEPPRRKRARPGTKMLGAARIRAEAAAGGSPVPAMAAECEAGARAPVAVEHVRVGAGGELVPMEDCAEGAALVLIDTLEKPDFVAADASRERLELLDQAGALSAGLDLAETVGARDSAERMLAHQMAALHTSTLKIAAQLAKATERLDVVGTDPMRRAAANVEACRLVGALSRLSATYQTGLGAMQRLRTGGRQTFVIQHNHVTGGGQAVIGGHVEGGGGSPKRRGRG